jgi:hypothetical protein
MSDSNMTNRQPTRQHPATGQAITIGVAQVVPTRLMAAA